MRIDVFPNNPLFKKWIMRAVKKLPLDVQHWVDYNVLFVVAIPFGSALRLNNKYAIILHPSIFLYKDCDGVIAHEVAHIWLGRKRKCLVSEKRADQLVKTWGFGELRPNANYEEIAEMDKILGAD